MKKDTQYKKVLVIGGPTGSGETTITRMIMEKYPIFKESVSATSRLPRENEKEGESYYFFSKEEFEQEIKKGNLVEYTYVESRNVYYGTYKPQLDEKIARGFNIIVNVDIVGAKYFKEKYNATTIFLKPDSIEILSQRIQKRNPGMSKMELEKRLKEAQKEIDTEEYYYDYKIINAEGKLNETFSQIEEILKKEGYELK